MKYHRTRRLLFLAVAAAITALLAIVLTFLLARALPQSPSHQARETLSSESSESSLTDDSSEKEDVVSAPEGQENAQAEGASSDGRTDSSESETSEGTTSQSASNPSVKGSVSENSDPNTGYTGSSSSGKVSGSAPSVAVPDPAPEEPDGQERYAYLTFDDGPSHNTEEILRILGENGVKATFFVIGRTDETSLQRYRKIVEAGHTLAMHSYTHNYGEIYASLEAFRADYEKISSLLTQITGTQPLLYRFPGGSSNTLSKRKVTMTELIQFLDERNIQYFDWNVNSADASGRNPDAGILIRNVKNGLKYRDNIILMHDSAGHETTVQALPDIIQACRDKGLIFRTITHDTPPAHHHRRD